MPNHMTKPTELAERQSKLFREFSKLSEKAQATLNESDGMAAGRAYKTFIDSFLTEAQIDELKGVK